MRKTGLIAIALLAFAGLATAQIPTSGNIFVGYSYLNSDLSTNGRASINGWEASVEGKVVPFLGFVADVDGHYGSQNIPNSCAPPQLGPGSYTCPTVSVDQQDFLFGPRVSFSVGKFRPFAEALFGGSHLNADVAGSDTSFATGFGGGLDYKIIRPIAWRFQGDYVQTRFFGTTQNNVRLSTGIVFRF